jgi:hypothetical protein
MGLLIVALRGAATLKARALKEVWNIAAVIPVEKGTVGGGQQHQKQSVPKQHHRKLECHGSSISDDVSLEGESNFLGICSQELLARGTELLKRTREGAVLVIISLVNDLLFKSSTYIDVVHFINRCTALEGCISVHQQDGPGKNDCTLKLVLVSKFWPWLLICGVAVRLQVMLKMKSRHVAGTITKKKKSEWKKQNDSISHHIVAVY